MNREIKFKAIRKDGKGWVYGDYFDTSKSSVCKFLPTIIENGGMNPIDFHLVNPKTVCQFTGLLDKNGREIYSNDLVINVDGNRLVVVWINEWAMFGCMFFDEFEKYTRGGIKELAESMFWSFPIESERLKVIGNIHEGKETKP
ncbi:YopX family protein [Sphingobacterium spiritivorum]|uniref:YopX family protein n=1 Tax=Sphingobacterium spiritivorum TaxID=258 RepID=UPI003DA5BF2F